MALLGNGWDDPKSAAIMALSGGLLRGDFGGGLLGANDAFAQARDSAFRKQYMDMQMQSMQSEVEARKLAAAQAKRKQDLIDGLLSGSTPAAPGQLGSGSFGILPPPAGQPGVPANGSRVASLNFDQLLALKAAGIDVTDIHKYANEPRKYESGSTYEDRVTGKREHFPRLPEGMAQGPNGRFSFVPGYADSIVSLEGAKAGATEGAKASFDPVQVVGSDGAARYVPRSQVVAPRPAASGVSVGADADRYALLTQELAKAEASGNTADAQAIRNEIARLPAAARTTPSPSGLAGGFQATPTTQQVADRVAAEATAKADVERNTNRQAEAKRFNQMMSGVDRAIELLSQGPTGSGFGRAIDAGAAFFGQSTKGAELSQQLKVLAGWLTSNVPRMEGPQSDRDVIQYREMAATVGDDSVPIPRRLAAARELKNMQQKYANLNGWTNTGGATGDFGPAAPKPPTPMKGMTRNGYRFKGGDPSKQENWEKL